ncbi:MAG: ElyC/SanA/YdcF family protein [Candidatus Promineifilaceae bacterium]|nr:ElyC/SanA/YdcF family protein [Candidatus Promineifilaceae bacterium]
MNIEDSFAGTSPSVQANKSAGVGKGCILTLLIILLIMSTPLLWRRAVSWYYSRQLHTPSSAPADEIAVVFGAAVYRNGRLSPVLRDRMETAIALYKSGKVEKILVSGARQSEFYDEPGAMMAYAITQGIPQEHIQADYHGLRTYDTCYRAHHVFHIKSALLVTQSFHLPRAMFTCRQLGVTAQGVSADLRSYRGMRWYEFRETLATSVALWDVFRGLPPQIPDESVALN